MLRAPGITRDGKKHVLGVWQGRAENARVWEDLIENLVERSLRADRRLLFVRDGVRALSKALKATLGKAAEIQRSHIHKERNALSLLPSRGPSSRRAPSTPERLGTQARRGSEGGPQSGCRVPEGSDRVGGFEPRRGSRGDARPRATLGSGVPESPSSEHKLDRERLLAGAVACSVSFR
ncbi:MAG: transposase [Planctomycetota bacterium]